MDQLQTIFSGIQFTDNNRVLEILLAEGIDDLETIKLAREEDLRTAGLRMGDIIKIRRTVANQSTGEMNISLSSVSEQDSDDTITKNWSSTPNKQEQNEQEPIPNVAVHYSAKDLLSKCTPGTRCTKAQLYFRNLLRDCARQAKIWDKAYHLPSLPDGKLNKFFELITAGAPQLRSHRSEVKARLGQALQNKRKYQNDVKVGKRKGKNVTTNMKENLTFSSAKVSKMDGSPLMERKDNLPSSPKTSNKPVKQLHEQVIPDVTTIAAFEHGEEVIVFKTISKTVKLAMATYLGLHDEEDEDEMYSLLQLSKSYLSAADDEVSLPSPTADGDTTLNELQINAVFTWKTSKLGRTLPKQTQNGSQKKKLKRNKSLSTKSGDDHDDPTTGKSDHELGGSKSVEIPLPLLKSHDGGKIDIGAWVAVAYNEGFFIGKVNAIDSHQEEVKVDFLARCKDGSYKWPKRKDTDKVNTKYIFSSSLRVQRVGDHFVLSNENSINMQFERYRKKYM